MHDNKSFEIVYCMVNIQQKRSTSLLQGHKADSVITSFLFMLDALTLSPSSVAACDGELVVFTCTVNEGALVWRITTPTRNYGPLGAFNSLVGMQFNTSDGVFKYGVTFYTTSPMELVSTLTTTATRSLDGTVVQCEGGGRSVDTNITLICNVDNNQGSPQKVLERCLMGPFFFHVVKTMYFNNHKNIKIWYSSTALISFTGENLIIL